MKKHALLYTAFFLVAIGLLSSKTYGQSFQKGTKLVDAGIEFTDYGGADVIPFFANFEAGVTDDIGIGAKVKFWKKQEISSVIAQATGSYHFGRILNLSVDQLDIFGSLGMGINRLSVNLKDYGLGTESESGFIITPTVGARYFFNEKVGATARLGFDHYTFDGIGETAFIFGLGVSFKF